MVGDNYAPRYVVVLRTIPSRGRHGKRHTSGEWRVYDTHTCTPKMYGQRGVVWTSPVIADTSSTGPMSNYRKYQDDAHAAANARNEAHRFITAATHSDDTQGV